MSQIPRFYFPKGKSVSSEVLQQTKEKIEKVFRQQNYQEGGALDSHEQLRPLLKEVVELPSFFSKALLKKLKDEAAAGGDGDGDGSGSESESASSVVSKATFLNYWENKLVNKDHQGRAFEILSDRERDNGNTTTVNGSSNGSGNGSGKYVTKAGLELLVDCIVHTHPGLDFLVQTPEFQDRYSETVLYRIFYQVNSADNGKISLKEFRKSNFLATLCELEVESDVNLVTQYFSYEHFYVIYCKFWELDCDHDFLISKDDLLRYGQHSLTCRIVDRIFSEAPRKFVSQVPGFMCYEDFVWFLLSEEDKTNDVSVNYWFRCLDLDGNNCLVSHELEHFYEEQAHRIECLNQEPVAFEDILTQLTDMLHPEMSGIFTIKDFRRNPRQASNLFNVLFNLKKFFSFETNPNDPSTRGGGAGEKQLNDWDRFARSEYTRLSMEEELAEQQSSMDFYSDETDLLVEVA